MTVAASDFEDWRRANPDASYKDFKFNLKKMSVSGALFDMVKFNDVSKNVISVMTASQVYNLVSTWAKDYNEKLYNLFVADSKKATAILNIDRDNPKPRKDIACWEEVENYVSFFYNELYTPDATLPEHINEEDAIEILTTSFNTNKYYRDYFELPFDCYTEKWENSTENVLNIKFIEELEGVFTERSGIIKTCLWDRDYNTIDLF